MILSFVTRNADETLDLWAPARPEKYDEANAVGRACAEELLRFIAATGDQLIFGSVLRAITTKGIWGGVEAGFGAAVGVHMTGLVEVGL